MLALEKENYPNRNILYLVYCFIFLAIISDIPVIFFYTITKSVIFSKYILYGIEFTILIISAYLFFKPSNLKFPVFLYLYGAYIIAITLVSLFFFDTYEVLRNSRKFLALLPPVIFGYYFGFYFWQKREEYIKKLILFLTIMSIIGLIEFIWWGMSESTLKSFYSGCFDIGSYYHYVRQTSGLTDSGIMTSGIRQTGAIIPNLPKRLTGFYCEPFAAGFNSSLAIVLILYCKMAEFKKIKWEYLILIINFIAVILTTSRSAYLFLVICILCFSIIKKKIHPTFLLCFLALLYKPFRTFCYNSIITLGGETHQEAALSLPRFIWSHSRSIEFLWGGCLGSMKNSNFSTESGYGLIFGQLGLFGLLFIFIFYFCFLYYTDSSKENKFFACSIITATSILLFFSGYIFGYKTYGLIHMFFGFIIAQLSFSSEYSGIFVVRPGKIVIKQT